MIPQSSLVKSDVRDIAVSETLSSAVKNYVYYSLKLGDMAEELPQTKTEIEDFDQRQIDLLVKKALVVEEATKLSLNSEADVINALKLWRLEKMESAEIEPIDELLLSVCAYYGIS